LRIVVRDAPPEASSLYISDARVNVNGNWHSLVGSDSWSKEFITLASGEKYLNSRVGSYLNSNVAVGDSVTLKLEGAIELGDELVPFAGEFTFLSEIKTGTAKANPLTMRGEKLP